MYISRKLLVSPEMGLEGGKEWILLRERERTCRLGWKRKAKGTWERELEEMRKVSKDNQVNLGREEMWL